MARRASVQRLLKQMVDGWPAYQKRLQRSFRAAGLPADEDDEDLELTVERAVPVKALATFKRGVSRPLSPMLRERFAFASTIVNSGQVWLAAKEVAKATRSRRIRGHHKARREHWEDSAPMRFEDSELSLFAMTPDAPEDVIYFVWKPEATEPELWDYHGMSERKFKDLEAFLRWCR